MRICLTQTPGTHIHTHKHAYTHIHTHACARRNLRMDTDSEPKSFYIDPSPLLDPTPVSGDTDLFPISVSLPYKEVGYTSRYSEVS